MGDFNWDVLDIMPHFTGALSMMGSTYIVVDILRNRSVRLKSPYYRILLALSAFDALSSFWFFIASWAKPPTDVFHVEGNPGNIATCNASGFFIQLGTTAIPLYNSALSMHFYLSIKLRWSPGQIYARFERYAHAVIPVLAAVLAIIPLPLKLYNPWYFYCYIGAFGQIDPDHYDGDGDEPPRFERGTLTGTYTFQLISMFIVFGSALFGIVVMTLIFLAHERVTRQSRSHSFHHQSSAFALRSVQLDQLDRGGSQRLNLNASRSRFGGGGSGNGCCNWSRNRTVAMKALLYTIPFFLTWVIPYLIFFRQQLYWKGGARTTVARPAVQYASLVYIATIVPLQGFFNWIIFMLPKKQPLNNNSSRRNNSSLNQSSWYQTYCKSCSCFCFGNRALAAVAISSETNNNGDGEDDGAAAADNGSEDDEEAASESASVPAETPGLSKVPISRAVSEDK